MSAPGSNRRILRRFYMVGLVVLAALIALIWQHVQGANLPLHPIQEATLLNPVQEPIQPLPVPPTYPPEKLALGGKLFQETQLSGDGRVSCLSCHSFQQGGADHQRYSVGVHGVVGHVNAPTLFNVAYNFRFNWNGKYRNLVDHMNDLIQNPRVMGSEWSSLVQKLEAMPEYRRSFATIYKDGITQANIVDAIVTYETSLTTPNSRFDQYLRGDQTALSAAEQEGYRLFQSYGCVSCHQGVNVGGNMFQKFGVFGDYFSDRGNITEADYGRFNVTRVEADRFVFRVPSLRNVAITPPYFHDGNAATLEEAIAIMVKYQLGRPIPPEHTQRIAEFLHTLTGEYEGVSLSFYLQTQWKESGVPTHSAPPPLGSRTME